MYIYKGRFCNIEELTTVNDRNLFAMMVKHRDEYEGLVFNEPVPSSYSEFQQKISQWFLCGRNYQFLVRQNTTDNFVGTMFFYNLSNLNKTVKCSCFFTPEVRGTMLIIESLALLLEFARFLLCVDSVRFSVYTENSLMNKMAKKAGASLLDSNLKTIDYEFSAETIDYLLKKHMSRVVKLI